MTPVTANGGVRGPKTLLIVVLAIIVSASTAKAQTTDAVGWIIQGGPYTGASFIGEMQFETGLRLGAQHGAGVLELSASTYPVQFQAPRGKHRGFEAMAGVAWQPSLMGIGFRSGLGLAPDAQGKLWSVLAFGPHYALAIPIHREFQLRGEAGIHLFYFKSEILGNYRGFVRLGIERRLR